MKTSYRVLAAFYLIFGVVAYAAGMSVPLSNNNYHVFRIAQDQPTQTIEFTVANAHALVIDVHTSGDQAAPTVSLTGPGGVVYDSDQFTVHTLDEEQALPLGAFLLEPGRHTQIEIQAPANGSWSLAIALPLGEAEVIGNATIVQLGEIGIGAFASRPLYASNQPAVIGAAIFEGSTPVAGAAVEARLYAAPDATPYVVSLFDSGIEPDAAAGDGLYTGSIGGLPAGHYTVEVVAVVGAASLISSTEFQVIDPLAQFTGQIEDRGVDRNGDGLLDELRLRLALHVTEPGGYALLGRLTAGEAEVTAGNRMHLEAGTTDAELSFPAAAIRQYLAADGPYGIADVILAKTDYGPLLGDLTIDRIANAGQTQPYALTELTRPAIVINTGLRDSATDDDADGLYDQLVVHFDVDLLRSETYTWSGVLQAEDGTVISVASGRNYLEHGGRELVLVFPGTDIGAQGLDGPYYLRDVAVYGQSGTAAVNAEVGITAFYAVSAFTGSELSFERLVVKLQELVITGPGGKPRGDGIRNSLLGKARNAAAMASGGRYKPAANLLEALRQELAALSGKHLSEHQVLEVIELIDRLSADLR